MLGVGDTLTGVGDTAGRGFSRTPLTRSSGYGIRYY